MVISKSKFVSYKTCPKAFWLSLNKPEERAEDPSAETNIANGKLVGSYAKLYFDNTVDVTSLKEDGTLDIEEMIGLTNRHLIMDTETIAEASFSVDGLFCSVDLLHKVDGGYEMYEVKASNTDDKDAYYWDMAFQQYVLEKRGLKVVGVYLMHLNREYRRHGDIEVRKLFKIDNAYLNGDYASYYGSIKQDIKDIQALVKDGEPNVRLSSTCKTCPFSKYCHRDVPSPSVLDLGRFEKRFDLYYNGIVTYQDLVNNKINLGRCQSQQIEAYLGPNKRIVHKDEINEYLKKLRYPIYHLDFESMLPPIPLADNMWPYEQVPTQYSLHIEYEDGRLEHKEFLGDSIDPRRAIAESLCRDIPKDVCVTAYHKSFECGRLNELADLYPDLADHLRSISNNVVDLEEPFSKGMLYDVNMGGRSSIKVVLPALCPNEPELDYHALPVVHNGSEAMNIYPVMLKAEPDEKQRIRDGLLKYCCLDTLAMVMVLRKLKEEAK